MSVRDYGIAAPNGPTKNIQDMDMREEGVFNSILRPDDMYDETGTYWADMNPLRQFHFVNNVNNLEAKKELGSIWRMIQRDPLSPVGAYFRNMVIPGAGLGLEG